MHSRLHSNISAYIGACVLTVYDMLPTKIPIHLQTTSMLACLPTYTPQDMPPTPARQCACKPTRLHAYAQSTY